MSLTKREKDFAPAGKWQRALASILVALTLLAFGACGESNQTQSRNAARPMPATPLDEGLDYVRKGQFMNVFVIKRHDGGEFTREDNEYLKANTHPETNQWYLTSDRRHVVAGTNFTWTPENMAALNQRFTVEDRTAQ